jgi:hypothetical protein
MSTTLSNNAFDAARLATTQSARARRHPVIMKMLVSGAIALGVWVGVAAPSSAQANSNQFGTVRCSCQDTASLSGRAGTEEMKRGIREGLSAGLGKPQP